MEFSVNREVIFPVLNKTNSLVKHRQTLPVLGNLLVVARAGRVTITGTDLEVEVKTSFEAEIKQEGDVTIPARKLFDICRNLSDGIAIRFKVKDERCAVTAGRGRFALGLLPADDFPTMNLEEGGFDFQLKESQLKQLLDKTAFAMAQQDVRYYLNGTLLSTREINRPSRKNSPRTFWRSSRSFPLGSTVAAPRNTASCCTICKPRRT